MLVVDVVDRDGEINSVSFGLQLYHNSFCNFQVFVSNGSTDLLFLSRTFKFE